MGVKRLILVLAVITAASAVYGIGQYLVTLRMSYLPFKVVTPGGSNVIDVPRANELVFNTSIGIQVTDERIRFIKLRVGVRYIDVTAHYWAEIENGTAVDFLTSAMVLSDSQGNLVNKTWVAFYDNESDAWWYYLDLRSPDLSEVYWIWFNTPDLTLGENPKMEILIEAASVERE